MESVIALVLPATKPVRMVSASTSTSAPMASGPPVERPLCVATPKAHLLAHVLVEHQATLTMVFVSPPGSNAVATVNVVKMKSACPQENVSVCPHFSPMCGTEIDAEVLAINSVVVSMQSVLLPTLPNVSVRPERLVTP